MKYILLIMLTILNMNAMDLKPWTAQIEKLSYDEKYVTSSVHNYISDRDNIIRKGAISAHCHENVVIPLNMGKDGGIILGTGLGNKDYNFSAPHGAGRVAGRNVMKKKLKSGEITMQQFNDTMRGIYSRSVVEGTIDESSSGIIILVSRINLAIFISPNIT